VEKFSYILQRDQCLFSNQMKNFRSFMYPLKKIPIVLGIVLLLCLTLPFSQAMAQTFSSGESQQIIQKVLANPSFQFRRSSDRVRGLRVISDIDNKESRFRLRANKRRAEATFVNYNQGRAYRVLVDPSTGVIARQEELPGRPQSSSSEREEAKQIMSKDPELAALLTPGVLVEGGFAVVPPPNTDPKHRYLQMHIVSSDRRSFLRIVTLDLTNGKIAASVQPQ
jgi:hypothetical protein